MRHGQARRHDTSVDPELSELGHAQAARLAAWFAGHTIHAVVSSPMVRAVQTAAPLAAVLGVEVDVYPDLAEYADGNPFYIPDEETDRRDQQWSYLLGHGDYDVVGDGEHPETFSERAFGAVESVIAAHPGESVAVVCHGGIINTYLGQVLNIPRRLWFAPANTGVSRVVASREGARTVVSVNETGHLHVVVDRTAVVHAGSDPTQRAESPNDRTATVRRSEKERDQ